MNRIDIVAPVARVTVSEDRAVVVRRGKAALPAGVSRLIVEGVAPVLVDKSVRVEISGVAAKVGEVRAERSLETVIPDDPAMRSDAQAIDALIESKRIAREELASAITRTRGELTLLDNAARHTLSDVAVDASYGTAPRPPFAATFEPRERELRGELVRLVAALTDADEELKDLRARRAALEHPGTQRCTLLVITVSAEAAGEASVAIEYVVPNACWRPQHTATLGAAEVRFATDACVWQATGEAWTDAELLFSTERPSLGVEPPELDDDHLAVQRKPEVLQVETRQEQIETAGLGGGGKRAAVKVPGIDDGGEARVLAASAKATVPTDGRPHRVPLSSFASKATVELVCMPELAEAAIVRSVQTNGGTGPLLAGPVDLVRQGGFVGRTTCEFIAPGEKFELGWGPDAGVRVHFDTEQVDEEAGMLSGWIARRVRQRVRISALDDAPRTLKVTMREPVSEIEKVQIAHLPKETTDGVKPDADGFVRWDVPVAPRGRKELELAYVLKRHKDVVGL